VGDLPSPEGGNGLYLGTGNTMASRRHSTHVFPVKSSDTRIVDHLRRFDAAPIAVNQWGDDRIC
jgi:hypothetical protein